MRGLKPIAMILLVLVLMLGAFCLGMATAPVIYAKTFYGTIVSINTEDGTYVVEGVPNNDVNHRGQYRFVLNRKTKLDLTVDLRGSHQFVLNRKTKVVSDNEPLQPEELSVGDGVYVTYSGSKTETDPAWIDNVYRISRIHSADPAS